MPNVPPRPILAPQTAFCPDSAFGWAGVIPLTEQNTAVIAVTNASGTATLRLNQATQVELYNAGSFDCAVALGDATVVAVFPNAGTGFGNYVVGTGQCKIITIPPQYTSVITTIAAICGGTNTTTLYASPGVGAS